MLYPQKLRQLPVERVAGLGVPARPASAALPVLLLRLRHGLSPQQSPSTPATASSPSPTAVHERAAAAPPPEAVRRRRRRGGTHLRAGGISGENHQLNSLFVYLLSTK